MGMQTGKSPGLDGIPPEFYLAFWDQLGPLPLDMINFSITRGGFSRDVNIAMISLLLKKDKNPTECNNYRPISLIPQRWSLQVGFAPQCSWPLDLHNKAVL